MTQTLNQEELKTEVTKALESMGCGDLLFTNPNEDLMIVLFNCKELTSFKMALPGWAYSGIQLDLTRAREYKIEFTKIK